jgi:hypothetical protein
VDKVNQVFVLDCGGPEERSIDSFRFFGFIMDETAGLDLISGFGRLSSLSWSHRARVRRMVYDPPPSSLPQRPLRAGFEIPTSGPPKRGAKPKPWCGNE